MQENATGNGRWQGGISEQQHRCRCGSQGNLGQPPQQQAHAAKNGCYIQTRMVTYKQEYNKEWLLHTAWILPLQSLICPVLQPWGEVKSKTEFKTQLSKVSKDKNGPLLFSVYCQKNLFLSVKHPFPNAAHFHTEPCQWAREASRSPCRFNARISMFPQRKQRSRMENC